MGPADDGKRRREDAAGDLVGAGLPGSSSASERKEWEDHPGDHIQGDDPGGRLVVGGVLIDGGGGEPLVRGQLVDRDNLADIEPDPPAGRALVKHYALLLEAFHRSTAVRAVEQGK